MTDQFTVRAVVCFLGAAALVGLIGLFWLVGTTDVRDAALLAIVAGPTGTVIGALSTLLARTGTDSAPQQVVGPGGGPLPVVDEAGSLNYALVTAVASVAMLAILVCWAWDLGPFAP